MCTGLAGAPTAFKWRKNKHTVAELLERTKFSRGDAHNPAKEKYLKREYFTVLLTCGATAQLYIERQPRPGSTGAARRQRWFIYTYTPPTNPA